MDTTNSTKGSGHRLGMAELALFVLGLIAVVGILAAVLYVSAPPPVAPAGVSDAAIASDASDPHVIKDALIASANAKRALAEQRRGEWDMSVPVAVSAQDALQEQRRGEWKISEGATAQDALQEQRRGEWKISEGATTQDALQAQGKGAQTAGNTCNTLPTIAEQARCLGVR